MDLLSYSCAAVDKNLTDGPLRGLFAIAELLVEIIVMMISELNAEVDLTVMVVHRNL